MTSSLINWILESKLNSSNFKMGLNEISVIAAV